MSGEIIETVGEEVYIRYPEDHPRHLVRTKFCEYQASTSSKPETANIYIKMQAVAGEPDPDLSIDQNFDAINREVLPESKLNLLSNTARNSAAKTCQEHFDIGLAWGTFLDDVIRLFREDRKKGNPIHNLKEGRISESSQYIIDPFVIQQQPNLLYGDGGLGKSWFALYLAALVSSGKRHGGLTPEPGACLYLDYEVDRQDMTNRFLALCNGLNIDPPDFYYRKQDLSVVRDRNRLKQLVDSNNIRFVIVDSAAAACGGEPESANVATAYWNSLRSLNCSTLTIAHVSKAEASEKGASSPYGSVFWRNYARNAWEIKQGTVYQKLRKEFGLTQTKLNSGAGNDPRNFLFTFDNAKLATSVNVEATLAENNDHLMDAQTGPKQLESFVYEERLADTTRPFKGVTAEEAHERYPGTSEGAFATILSRSRMYVKYTDDPTLERGRWDLKSERDSDRRVAQQEKSGHGWSHTFEEEDPFL